MRNIAKYFNRKYDPVIVILLASLIQLVYLFTSPITTTLDSGSYARLMMGNADPGGSSEFMFSFLAQLVGVAHFRDLTNLMALQSIFSILMPLLLFCALFPISRVAAWLGTFLFVISFSPFIYSTWWMLEHIYMFSLCLIIFAYSRFVTQQSPKELALLMMALWFAFYCRPNGAYLFWIVLCAFAFLAFFQSWLRQKKMLLFIAASFGLLFAGLHITSKLAGYYYGQTDSSMSARFLFCNVYGHAKEGLTGKRLQLNSDTARPILDAVKNSFYKTPELPAYFAGRWPETMGKYARNPQLLLNDIRTNADGGPTMNSTNHQFCWYILQSLDAAHTKAETNTILRNVWKETLFHDHFGWRYYASKLFGYYFEKPDNYYHGVDQPVTPQINPFTIPAHIYAQIAYSPTNKFVLAAISWINAYWLSFMLNITSLLSMLTFLAIPLVFFSSHGRGVSVFLIGLILFHGLVNAITNTIDVRYIAVIYPALCGMVGILVSNIIHEYKKFRVTRNPSAVRGLQEITAYINIK